MSPVETALAAALTIATLIALTVRQILGMRTDARPPRWLSALSQLLLAGFVVAMAARLSTAL